ncbi:hypothetical protein [Bordetella flabilis]|uniref:Uncharacterized protein n=1 Tax=Bordetella flabilis TaxID=463014 RepID=A0A193GEJ6_9BORD|nr:hypothetical protein [Bordetella flabilis]ANN78033.1 hypothetical protein BAU07_13885 [Bordetella flabilis]
MPYRHPHIGVAFDLPEGWVLEGAELSADGATITHRCHRTRLSLQIKPGQGNGAARLSAMTEQLTALGAAGVTPAPPPPFRRTRDIVALAFELNGEPKRWISVMHDGYDYTVSHTDHWQDVAVAVDRMAGTFAFPEPHNVRRALDAFPADLLTPRPPSAAAGIPGAASLHGDAALAARLHFPGAMLPALWQALRARLRRSGVRGAKDE